MVRLIPALLLLVAACRRPSTTPPSATAPLGATRAVPAEARPHATVLLSLDGFRADYLERPGAVRLRALAARGVRAERLIPSFPAKTFPSHHSLATGLHPEHHGLVANTMQDPAIPGRFTISDTLIARDTRWWGGEPIWITAEKQGVRTAAFFWPGSDYLVAGGRPTEYRPYDGRVPNRVRITQLLDWLTRPPADAPRLVLSYLSTTDDVGHAHGPDAPQVDSAIAHVDSLVGMLEDGLAARGLAGTVNLVVVADHGMTAIDRERVIHLDDYVDLATVDVVDWMPVTALQPKPGALETVYAALRGAHPHLQVFRKDSVPARFHYRSHPRIPPLVLMADEGWTITSRARARVLPPPRGGTHGYDNALPSMGALFVAAGPDLVRGRRLPPIPNVEVYDLVAALLGVRPAPNDGTGRLRAVLAGPLRQP